MARTKRGNVARLRRKKILRRSRGFKGSHSKLFRTANQQVMKSLRYAYVGRKHKKREFRKLWIIRINAAARTIGTNYHTIISTLKERNITLNRKMLALLIVTDPQILTTILKK